MVLDDYPVGAMIDQKFNTQSLGAASITMATDGAVRIYKDNSTAERGSAAGITFTEDFDSVVGVHHLRIDTADDTDPAFYSAGHTYHVVLASAVVDGVTVNTTLYAFSIEFPGGVLALLKSATAGLAAASASNIKRNQALAKFVFQMADAVTHAPKPGINPATITCLRSLDGVISAAGTLANVEEHPDADGSYLVDFGAGDLNAKVIKFTAAAPGADTTFERIITVP